MHPGIEAVSQWLIDGARSACRPEDVLATLCTRLLTCGIPLWRVIVFVRTLPPSGAAWRAEWRLGAPVSVTVMAQEECEEVPFAESPMPHVCRSGVAIRCRLDATPHATDFPGLAPFSAEGVTDYWAMPLLFSDGKVQVASWMTRQTGGFTDEQLRGIQRVLPPLARVAEIHTLRRVAVNLLETYVGRRSGERILAGAIRRGDTESIHAVIWLSDMRGFTSLTDRRSSAELVALLNHFFDCQIPAIARHGGEVLKFMGDGLLAIFPVKGSVADVCAGALAAAQEASAAVAAMAADPKAAWCGVCFGLALHLGEVAYGNVGSERRLDFTCIGAAVNLVARLEKLAGELGRTIVASSAFACQCASPLLRLGEFAFAGFSRRETVFAVPQTPEAGSVGRSLPELAQCALRDR